MMQNRRVGFVLVAAVMLVIVSSVSLTYFTGRHYAAAYSFNEARSSITAGTTLDEIEQAVAESFELSGKRSICSRNCGIPIRSIDDSD